MESVPIPSDDFTDLLPKKKKKRKLQPLDDPTVSIYDPSRYLGATSERFAERVEEFVRLLKEKAEAEAHIKRRVESISVKNFKTLMNVKYMRSLVDPGEAVGLLASQG